MQHDVLKLWLHQQLHNFTIYLLFILLRSCMFRHCRHFLGVCTKISLKRATLWCIAVCFNETFV